MKKQLRKRYTTADLVRYWCLRHDLAREEVEVYTCVEGFCEIRDGDVVWMFSLNDARDVAESMFYAHHKTHPTDSRVVTNDIGYSDGVDVWRDLPKGCLGWLF